MVLRQRLQVFRHFCSFLKATLVGSVGILRESLAALLVGGKFSLGAVKTGDE